MKVFRSDDCRDAVAVRVKLPNLEWLPDMIVESLISQPLAQLLMSVAEDAMNPVTNLKNTSDVFRFQE